MGGRLHGRRDIDVISGARPHLLHRLQITRGAGYDGWLGIEYEGKEDPMVGIERGIRKLRNLLTSVS